MKTAVLVGNRTLLSRGIISDLREKEYDTLAFWADVDAEDGKEVNPLYTDSLFDAAGTVKKTVDLLIVNLYRAFDCPKATVLDRIDYEALKQAYDYNSLGVIRAVNAFLPLLERGEGKRIAIITNRESSNNLTRETGGYGDHVGHAPLNMAVSQLFNGLRPEGYTFRMYVREAMDGYDPFAAEYITRNRSNDPDSCKHSDENRLILRDSTGCELPW